MVVQVSLNNTPQPFPSRGDRGITMAHQMPVFSLNRPGAIQSRQHWLLLTEIVH